MKITPYVVDEFEREQQDYGTFVAIYNLLWNVAAEGLKDIGVRKISTVQGKPEKNSKYVWPEGFEPHPKITGDATYIGDSWSKPQQISNTREQKTDKVIR
jgi:hypothetical protein